MLLLSCFSCYSISAVHPNNGEQVSGLTLGSATLIFLVVFWSSVGVWWFLSGFKRKIKIITITGPSGAGKGAIVARLLKKHSDWRLVVSLTSRGSRSSRDLPGEYECDLPVEYLRRLDEEGEALWLEGGHRNVYVTLKADVDRALRFGVLWFMQILHKSVCKLHEYAPGRVLSIFILPPDKEELRWRLAERNTESPEEIERRIADCEKWEEEARASGIPYEFVRNDGTVEEAVRRVEEIIRHKV